jgi:hypothetical protein
VSYPSPPGPQNPPPQGRPTPGWQSQPYQQQTPPYQPQGGNWAAPPYGGPPRRNRASLIIVLIVVLLVGVLGIGGFLAYRLTSGNNDSGGTAPAAPPTTGKVTRPVPSKTVPSAAPSKIPTKPAPTKTAPSKPVDGKPTKASALALAGRFTAALNADNIDAAAALGCPDTKEMLPTLISIWVKAPTKLTATNAVLGDGPTFIVPITGTTHGQQMGGLVIVEGNCIRVLQLNPT